ncbi:type II toxin -antitoxin system TacA 1-like antitoxin [Microcoleus sp. B3-D7]|uniref:type II toxin -antitoxin system TacA 1-like antitoxin n=1 Tax=Microcoleus sp. B3-D7 TaxID=2818659 RepID=UPI002FCE7937
MTPNQESKTVILKLNQQDSEVFVEALLNPALPNKALLVAAFLYKKTISNNNF